MYKIRPDENNTRVDLDYVFLVRITHVSSAPATIIKVCKRIKFCILGTAEWWWSSLSSLASLLLVRHVSHKIFARGDTGAFETLQFKESNNEICQFYSCSCY